MPHNKHPGKQGCNCQFRNHKILNPRKIVWSTFTLQFLFMLSATVFHRFFVASFSVCYLSVVIFHIASCFVFVFVTLSIISNLLLFLFCSLCFIWLLVVWLFSVFFCSDTGNLFQVFWSSYQQPSHKSINIITQDWAPFVLTFEARTCYPHRH